MKHRPRATGHRRRASRALALGVATVALLAPGRLGGASDTAAAHLANLGAEAGVVTDRWGIPHVRAASILDLYQAWGWTAARDRLWQMVHARAAGEGMTHRWLGNRALQADGGAQLFRMRERASDIWRLAKHDRGVRESLLRYCMGVNSYLAECRRGARPWPAELQRLGEKPRDWTPEDCVLVLLGFGITLDLDLPELGEARAVGERGAAWATRRRRFEDRWIYDTIPDSAARRLWGDHGGARARGRAARTSRAAARAEPRAALPASVLAGLERALRAFPLRAPDGSDRASNAFVVGPARSASGKPILANDPHLALATPGPFHIVHLFVPGALNAIGASVAGLPIIASGRNERVAWGVTALSADVVDVIADSLSADGRRVLGHAALDAPADDRIVTLPFDLRFRVLGLGLPVPPFVQARRYSPHGPVLVWDPKRRLALSARWTALDGPVITLEKLFGIERATNAREVEDAFASLVTPCFNLVVADVDGDVRYRSVGAIPRRATLPGPGPQRCDRGELWGGVVPADSMPGWHVPVAGYAVNGNNRPAGEGYPYPLPRFDWVHDRARRMAQRLEGDRSITLADAASVQNDVYSLAAERWVPLLLERAEPSRDTLPERMRTALDTLRAWDGYARRSRVGPTLFRAWLAALQRRSGLEGAPGLAFAALSGEAPEALAIPGSPGEQESPERAAVAALAMALDTLSARLGPDLAQWTYARAHRARFRHALSALDSRERWEPPLTPEDGDNATPSVAPSRLPWSTEVVHGPAFRHVVDLAQPLLSLGVVPPWNSAAFPGSGERDLRARWAAHGYVPFHMDWARIEAVAMHRVRLVP
jgi:penicillin amidase